MPLLGDWGLGICSFFGVNNSIAVQIRALVGPGYVCRIRHISYGGNPNFFQHPALRIHAMSTSKWASS